MNMTLKSCNGAHPDAVIYIESKADSNFENKNCQ